MKRNILKIWAYLALVSINSLANAGTGQAFFGALNQKHKSTILPDRINSQVIAYSGQTTPTVPPAATVPPSQTPAPMSASASTPGAIVDGSSLTAANKGLEGEVGGSVFIENLTINNNPATAKDPVTLEPQNPGLFTQVKNGFNSFSEWISDCLPSSNTLMKTAFGAIAASNTYKRYCQAKTFYNNKNIFGTNFAKYSLLTAISAAGTVMANDACREKAGPLLSTILVGATAFDIMYQKYKSSIINKLKEEDVIKEDDESPSCSLAKLTDKKDINCAGCSKKLFKASNISFDGTDSRQLGFMRKEIVFPDGDIVDGTKQARYTKVYCSDCKKHD